MSKQQANLVCLLVAAIWGGGFIATNAALRTFDPFTVLMIRFIGASIVSIIVCFNTDDAWNYRISRSINIIIWRN